MTLYQTYTERFWKGLRLMSGQIDAGALLLVEYEHLKEEQRLRIGTRDNLVYATLGAIALVVAGTTQAKLPIMLLLTPPVCMVLGWTFLANDDRITAIGRHIENAIIPALSANLPPGTQVFSWELAHRTDRGRWVRKTWQAAIDLLTFVAAPIAALAVVALTGTVSPIVLGIGGAELLGMVLLAYQLLAHAVRRAAEQAP